MLTKNDLIDYFKKGCKPPDRWRIGLEHEQFIYNINTGKPLPYDGDPGVKQVLEYLSEHCGWKGQKFDNGHLIALYKDNQSITIEPAGQMELSGAPHLIIQDLVQEHQAYSNNLRKACNALNISFFSRGFPPEWALDDMHWMPKSRYKIMREYMPKRGSHGLDMMARTCGAQINLDYESEADMIRKLRVMIALQPFIIALFANSDVVEGRKSDFASYRAHIWDHTDPDRTGILPFIFQDGAGFEAYAEYMLDVPMYFIEREGALIDMSGKSFRQFMAGNLPENESYEATLKDWEDHLSTGFPEVRLKTYLELRGADSVPPPKLYALAAFWVGLIYCNESLNKAADYIQNWSIEDHLALRQNVPEFGLQTRLPQGLGSIEENTPQLIEWALQGLKSQPLQAQSSIYLQELLSP